VAVESVSDNAVAVVVEHMAADDCTAEHMDYYNHIVADVAPVVVGIGIPAVECMMVVVVGHTGAAAVDIAHVLVADTRILAV